MHKDTVIERLLSNEDFLKKRYFIENLILFGSYATQLQNEKSDIDLIYQTRQGAPMTLARLESLESYLSSLLNSKKIELVSKSSLNPIVASNISQHAITIF